MTGFRKDELYQIGPSGCPKFEACLAPICPLDSDWRLRSHLRGDAICLWLREMAKGVDLRGNVAELSAEAIAEQAPAILSRYGHVRQGYERASGSPSKRRRVPRGDE